MKPNNPYEERKMRAGIGATGRKAEKRASKRYGARLTPASGALESHKGDFTVDNFLCENKSTVNGSFALKLEWLQKITREAAPNGKTPALTIQFTTANGEPVKAGSWVMLPESTFKELTSGG